MRFQVPQFIEVEDKIFGPLTLKQFLYLIGGGAAVFLLYVILPFFIFVLAAIPIAAFSVALAFYKMHGQPFIKTVENAFRYFRKNKIYTWKKEDKPIKRTKTSPKNTTSQPDIPTTSTKDKLSDLAWSLDIKKQHGNENN
ncbi:PrgI family protein [Patescibacteria group bacterium]